MEPLTHDEKKDLILNYFREKHKSGDSRHDSDNRLWSQLANRTCGGPGAQFSQLVESLVPTYLSREYGGIQITPEGVNFMGFVEQKRRENETQELDLEHKKAVIRASTQKSKTTIWTIVSTIFAVLGTISAIVFAYLNWSDKQEIKDLKQEVKMLNQKNIKLSDSIINIKHMFTTNPNPHSIPHSKAKLKTKSP